MTLEEFLSIIMNDTLVPTQLRKGQHAFNRLAEVRPDLAEKIEGDSDVDPFYRNDRLGNFVAFLQENW